MTEWTKHAGTGKPPELADGQIVEAVEYLENEPFMMGFERADKLPWERIRNYRPALTEDGLPYVSAEGLYPWADIVFTDEHGNVWQVSEDPSMRVREMGGFSVDWYQSAPESHRIPKARVWRE